MITWNPNDKTSGVTLSNNNLTATIVNHADSNVRATKGIEPLTDKIYYEVLIDSTTHVNICQIGLRTKTSLTWLGGFANFGDAIAGRIIGIAVGNGKIRFYKDGIFDREVDLGTSELIYPALGTGAVAVKHTWVGTANFGATPFDIITSNPEAWTQLLSEGYLPYDTNSAGWFTNFKLNNIDISKTNIFNTETGDIKLSANVFLSGDNIETNIPVNYTISVNNFTVTDTQITPFTLNATIPKSELNIGANLLTISLESENYAAPEFFNYSLIVEDKNTIKAVRKYDFASQFIHDTSKTTIALDKGAGLKEGFAGKDTIITTNNSNINTTGRRTIEKIEVAGNEDTIEEATIVEDMTLVGAVGEGYIWKKEINLEREIIGLRIKSK